MSIENLKALADVGFNGDMQLGLIANNLLTVVGTSGAQRRSALQAIARDVESLSVADIKRRKLSSKTAQTAVAEPVATKTVSIKSKSKSSKTLKASSSKGPKSKTNGATSKSASASA